MRWTQAVSLDERTEADGEVVWSQRPEAGVKVAGLTRERRWQKSPVTGGVRD
jgi:hypothetical protein